MIVDQNLQKDEYCKHVRMINLSKTFLGILEQNTYNRIYTFGAYGIKLYSKIWVIAKHILCHRYSPMRVHMGKWSSKMVVGYILSDVCRRCCMVPQTLFLQSTLVYESLAATQY